jgi:hypothetical protein
MYCHGEEAPIATSGEDGVLAFEIETQRSPGCGYQRCRNTMLRDPHGRFVDTPLLTARNERIFTLERAP